MGLAKLDSIDLSRYIIAKCGDMPHLKLQKLIYYVEAYHSAYFEQSLIDDNFEAWMHGPVSTKVWHHFKDFQAPLYNQISINEAEKARIISDIESKLTLDQQEFIGDVLAEFGDKTAYYLECLTHQELPWIEARDGIPPESKCTKEISKKTMATYYRAAIYVDKTT